MPFSSRAASEERTVSSRSGYISKPDGSSGFQSPPRWVPPAAHLMIAMGASTDSVVNRIRFGGYDYAALASYSLVEKAVAAAKANEVSYHVGNIFSADLFYTPDTDMFKTMAKYDVLGVEMEATAVREPGVRVVRVLRGSPAAVAGVQPNDVILTIHQERVDAPEQMGKAVASIKPGTEIGVTLLRRGQQKMLRVQLEGVPEFEDRLRLAFIGQHAPSIDGVVTFQGSAASLTDLKGRVVLLEFWASWCGVCRYLAPVLTDWQRSYRPAGLEVVGITTDPPKLGAEAARDARMDYTLMSDADSSVTRNYLASQVPTVFVLNREGVVVDVMVGLNSRRLKEVRALVEELIDEPG